MDKGFERCCNLIARMIEKYGDKCFRKSRKRTHIRFINGKLIMKKGKTDMLLITSWYISVEKRQLRKNRSMYKKICSCFFGLRIS